MSRTRKSISRVKHCVQLAMMGGCNFGRCNQPCKRLSDYCTEHSNFPARDFDGWTA
jgi:hypothetical protein